LVTSPTAEEETANLQAYDGIRVHDLLDIYSTPTTATVRIEILETPATYVGTVKVEIVIPPLSGTLPHWIDVAIVAVPLPLRSLEPVGEGPPRIDSLQAWHGDQPIPVRQSSSTEKLTLAVEGRHLRGTRSPVTLSFTSASVYLLYGGDGALQTWRLGLDLDVPQADSLLVKLDHSPELSLRCRVDSSEYHSLAQGVANGTVRKLGFYPGRPARIRYLFGAHSEALFRGLALFPFAGCLGLLAAGLTLALLAADLDDMAAVGLALALFPPVVQAIRPSGGFYRSADIRSRGPGFLVALLTVTIYVGATLFALVTITDLRSLRMLAEIICYAAGGVLGVLGSVILLAVREQVLPPHYCDGCTKRLWWRRRSHLHWKSRRTLCGTCYKKILGSEQTGVA
jgi:hypothetical protein